MFNCLNDCVNLHKMLGSFASRCHCPPDGPKLNVNYSTTLEKIVTSDKTWCSGCLEDNNDLFNLIRLFASGTTNTMVPKLELKIVSNPAHSVESEIINGF